MIITEKSFILVEEPTGTLVVDDNLEALLRKEMRPILWFRSGLSCVVPVEVLKNVLEYLDIIKCNLTCSGGSKAELRWKQCWPLTDSRAVAVLSGLKH